MAIRYPNRTAQSATFRLGNPNWIEIAGGAALPGMRDFTARASHDAWADGDYVGLLVKKDNDNFQVWSAEWRSGALHGTLVEDVEGVLADGDGVEIIACLTTGTMEGCCEGADPGQQYEFVVIEGYLSATLPKLQGAFGGDMNVDYTQNPITLTTTGVLDDLDLNARFDVADTNDPHSWLPGADVSITTTWTVWRLYANDEPERLIWQYPPQNDDGSHIEITHAGSNIPISMRPYIAYDKRHGVGVSRRYVITYAGSKVVDFTLHSNEIEVRFRVGQQEYYDTLLAAYRSTTANEQYQIRTYRYTASAGLGSPAAHTQEFVSGNTPFDFGDSDFAATAGYTSGEKAFLSPCGRYAVVGRSTANDSDPVKLYRGNGRLSPIIWSPSNAVQFAATVDAGFSPDGKRIVIATYVFNGPYMIQLVSLDDYDYPTHVYGMSVPNAGARVAMGNNRFAVAQGNVVSVYTFQSTPTLVATITVGSGVGDIAMAPDDSYIAVGFANKVRLYTGSAYASWTEQGFGGTVSDLRQSRNGQWIAASSLSVESYLLSVSGGTLQRDRSIAGTVAAVRDDGYVATKGSLDLFTDHILEGVFAPASTGEPGSFHARRNASVL